MYNNKLWDDFFDTMPTCETVHPLCEKMLLELRDAPDRKEMWENRLSLVELQMRDCLAVELSGIIPVALPTLPPDISPEQLIAISQLVLTIGWLASKEIAPKFEVKDE